MCDDKDDRKVGGLAFAGKTVSVTFRAIGVTVATTASTLDGLWGGDGCPLVVMVVLKPLACHARVPFFLYTLCCFFLLLLLASG